MEHNAQKEIDTGMSVARRVLEYLLSPKTLGTPALRVSKL